MKPRCGRGKDAAARSGRGGRYCPVMSELARGFPKDQTAHCT